MFEGQPKGLWALALANTGERFGYYTMLAVFILFLQANFGWTSGTAGSVYAAFLACVYFLPIIGGAAADKWGYSKMVTIGIFIMFIGYAILSIPMGADIPAIVAMAAALLLVSLGTGLFKGNLQVMVGDLYNEPAYADKRDSGFSLFYMLINVGAMFAPTAAIGIMDWAQKDLHISAADSYHFAFAVACVSLIVSIAIYYTFKRTFTQVLKVHNDEGVTIDEMTVDMGEQNVKMSASETKERIICLILVFAVVIFFWMAFHQNGATLTYFARDYTATTATGITAMEMDVTNLVACIFIVYALFSLLQHLKTEEKSKRIIALITFLATGGFLYNLEIVNHDIINITFVMIIVAGMYILYCAKDRVLPAIIIFASIGFLVFRAYNVGTVEVSAPIFQQFNPCFVIALTPVSIGIFGWLAKKGKEPKAPVKIGLGMLVAAISYLIMTVFTLELPAPNAENPVHLADMTPNLLVLIYLIMTFAELLLSPIGISFVTKVAPPKYKGTMMGGWFVATAVGNFLVSIPTMLWGSNLYVVWGTLMGICLVAALFIFSIIKKLNKVA